MFAIFVACLVLTIFTVVQASNGDRSAFYTECVNSCQIRTCYDPVGSSGFYHIQPFLMKWMGWDCLEECRYQCIWPTVAEFESNGLRVPKFYGKWPFIRVLGFQEIISSIASLLNLIPHALMLRELRKKFHKFYPMYYAWQVFAVMNVNAWFWSFLFHMKDTQFTEIMDYFCAFSLIVFNLYFCFLRFASTSVLNAEYHLFTITNRLSLDYPLIHMIAGVMLALYTSYHFYYMLFVVFDYGYNMKVGITLGVSSVVIWILWFLKVRHRQPYTSKVLICGVSALLLMSLEILDFPPILWLFDAHAIWHLGTAPIIFIWYRFVFEDIRFLKKDKSHKA